MSQTRGIDRERDPYRWRCPNGHTSWWPSGDGQITCGACQSRIWDYRAVGSGPEHAELQDGKTGVTVPVAEVELVADE
jgi:hypothetical protein